MTLKFKLIIGEVIIMLRDKILIVFSWLLFSFPKAYSHDLLQNIMKDKELRICQTAGYAPYSYKNINGSWAGLNIAIDDDFAKFLRVQPIHVEVEWTGAIAGLLTKKCDMLSVGLVDTVEREKVISFGDPIYTNNIVFVLRNDPELLKRIFVNDSPNYSKLNLAVASGTSSEYWARIKHIKILTYKTYDAPIEAVLDKKVDGFIFEEKFVKKLPPYILGKLFIYNKPIQVENVSAGFRKEDEELKNKFNEFVKFFLKSNHLQSLQKKY